MEEIWCGCGQGAYMQAKRRSKRVWLRLRVKRGRDTVTCWRLNMVREMCLQLLTNFFFFQAEDGIRDKLVTGVQTCALPISSAMAGVTLGAVSGTRLDFTLALTGPLGAITIPFSALANYVVVPASSAVETVERSEERRVGKEGKSRWSAYL